MQESGFEGYRFRLSDAVSAAWRSSRAKGVDSKPPAKEATQRLPKLITFRRLAVPRLALLRSNRKLSKVQYGQTLASFARACVLAPAEGSSRYGMSLAVFICLPRLYVLRTLPPTIAVYQWPDLLRQDLRHIGSIAAVRIKFAALVALLALLTACSGNPHTPAVSFRPQQPQPPFAGIAPVAVIGDSDTVGSEVGGRGANSWPKVVEKILGKQQVAINAVVQGGSGYVNPGNIKDGVFADHVGRIVNSADRVVVLFGSRDDADVLTSRLIDAVRGTLAKAKAAAPGAGFIVIGPTWPGEDPPAGVLQARDVVRSQAHEFGATWVDPIAEGWFVDRPDLIGADGIHPNDAGHFVMAERLAPLIAAELAKS